jgi:hypothetical protein
MNLLPLSSPPYTEDGGKRFLETSATIYNTVWCHIPEEGNPDIHYYDDVRYYILFLRTLCAFTGIVKVMWDP